MTGAPKRSSSSAITWGGSGAEDDLMNRSRARDAASGSAAAAARTAWWIVGTAVYQVAAKSCSHPRKRRPSKPEVQITLPLTVTLAARAATSPWMWNSGITLRQRSAADKLSVAATLLADAHRLAWVSGTCFGRDVVPLVCRTRATSSGAAGG